MTRNPYLNALAASAYIVVVAFVMFYGTDHTGQSPTVLIPIAVLSLFALSAAVMAFIFFFQPIQMFLDGHKQQAVELMLKTIGTFACITLLFLVVAFVINR